MSEEESNEQQDPKQEEDPSEPNPQQQYDWSAFYDDEGRIYFYNNVTGESSWDEPEIFNPPPPPEEDNDDENENAENENQEDAKEEVLKSENEAKEAEVKAEVDDDVEMENTTAAAAADGRDATIEETVEEAKNDEEEPLMAGDWIEYKDDEGRAYYFNTVTEETTWDRPTEFDTLEETTTKKEASTKDREADTDMSPERQESPVMMDELPESPLDDNQEKDDTKVSIKVDVESDTVEKEEQETIDPAIKRLEDAKKALSQPDAIMENGILSNLTEVVKSDEGNPQKAIQALSESARGQTAICGLLARWLADLKSHKDPSSSMKQKASTSTAIISETVTEETKRFEKSADDIREMTQEVVNRIAKERFTKTGGDSILNLSKSEAAFLEDMMDSNRWRKLLIDLSATNKDSALLMYCLQAISKRGHHREIARRINQSDHFAVFNSMLASELAVMGKVSVSSCHDHDTSISLNELVNDLQRTCTSTAYTFLYAFELLRFLVQKAKGDSSEMTDSEQLLYARVIRKWERLLEVLQGTMIDPSSASASTPLFRKRRLDVACTISELHQRQRRRLYFQETSQDSGEEESMSRSDSFSNGDSRHDDVETALLTFLRRYCLGTQLDDQVLDKMLPNTLGDDTTNFIGNLLIQYPTAIEALLGYIYKPGNQRVRSVVTRNKCARLAAMAVLAAERKAVDEARKIDPDVSISDLNEVELTRMLSEGSQLCELLENMVSFVVTIDADTKKGAAALNPGEKLCSLAIRCAPVSQGVAMWAREITKGGEFVGSASYATLSPNIMSLVRIIYLQHPFTRDDTCDVAFEFLKHSNSEIAYQTMNSIKEQSLRLLIFLCIRGEAPTVLGRMTHLLKDSSKAYLDASLVRYFVSGLLDVANPPYSIPFIRSLISLLESPACVSAVKTTYFDRKSKSKLDSVVSYLKTRAAGRLDKQPMSKQDVIMIKSLSSIYAG